MKIHSWFECICARFNPVPLFCFSSRCFITFISYQSCWSLQGFFFSSVAHLFPCGCAELHNNREWLNRKPPLFQCQIRQRWPDWNITRGWAKRIIGTLWRQTTIAFYRAVSHAFLQWEINKKPYIATNRRSINPVHKEMGSFTGLMPDRRREMLHNKHWNGRGLQRENICNKILHQ